MDVTLTNITELLSSENNWTASNAALVLARLDFAQCLNLQVCVFWRMYACDLMNHFFITKSK